MKPLIIANWKMNPPNKAQAEQLFNLLKKGLKGIKGVEAVLCPPFVYLANSQMQALNFKLGSQDCFWEEKGAFTGEISPPMLKNLGVEYVIIGHSERRKWLKEDEETINKKLKTALKAGLKTILCIGESKEEREKEKTPEVLLGQLKGALKEVGNWKLQLGNLAIAYEPIWAIGTGNACDVEEAQKIGLLIFKFISRIYNSRVAAKVKILYGGSVNSKNSAFYIKEGGFGGLLVGGASLDAKEFIKIIKSVI